MGGAHVTRVGFPTSVEEWEANLLDNGVSDLELLLTSGSVIWSAPAWALVGDIVLFQMTLRAAAAWKELNRALSDPEQLIDDGAGGTVFPDWFVRSCQRTSTTWR